MISIRKSIVFLLLVLCYTNHILGQAVNDEPCDATAISLSSSDCCNQTMIELPGSATETTSPFSASCQCPATNDVWYSMVCPSSGSLTLITSSLGSISDPGMALYSGACSGSLTEIACNEDNGADPFPYLNVTGLSPGNTYYLRVWSCGGENGWFGLCAIDSSLATTTNVSNDSCINAIELTSEKDPYHCETASYCMTGATASNGYDFDTIQFLPCGVAPTTFPDDYNPNADVWFYFDAISPVEIFTVQNITGDASGLCHDLFEGTACDDLSFISCGDSWPVTWTGLTPLNRYYVRVYQKNDNFVDNWPSVQTDTNYSAFSLCLEHTFVLSTELDFFSGGMVNDHNELVWSTQSETNISHFLLKRSSDGHYFKTISSTPAKGKLDQKSTYNYLDYDDLSPLNYYQLSQVDLDGNESQIGTTVLIEQPTSEFHLYPNPTEGKLNFRSNYDQALLITFISVSGKEWQVDYEPSTGGIELDEQIKPGIYFVRISDEEGNILHQQRILRI